jgi:uncharacterized protein
MEFTDFTAGQPPVLGILHEGRVPGDALVLTHGAGGNRNAPLLVAVAEALAQQGISVLRCDLPFRQRKSGPPSPANAAEDQAGLRRAAELLRARTRGHIFLGGQSYGGRQASMLLAAEPKAGDGLLLLSYPLHPPGKPQQLRTKHLPELKVPVLFVSGTKDPFGTIPELEDARKLIPVAELIAVPGAGHSLLTKLNRAELVTAIVAGFERLRGLA